MLCDFVLQAAEVLQALNVMVFVPVVEYFVEKVPLLPLEGKPPEAVQVSEVTLPLIDGLQLTV